MSTPLPDSARRLLRLLSQMSVAERRHATNLELAARIGTTDRTITTALGRLETAGRVRIRRASPHPLEHTTGRHIDVLENGVWR